MFKIREGSAGRIRMTIEERIWEIRQKIFLVAKHYRV